MTIPAFLRRKSTYIILVLVLGGGGWIVYRRSRPPVIVYETAAVEQRDLLQTVEVTGEMKPASRIDLVFQNTGALEKLNVRTGDVVKQGDVLAELKTDDARFAARSAAASLSIARANLGARLAGETTQSIQVAEAQAAQAKASYDKAVSDIETTKQTTQENIKSAEIALQTAQNNLNNQEGSVNLVVAQAYDSARTSLLTALGPLQTGLSDGDQIVGVDNTAANQTYVGQLGFLDSGSLDRAKASYKVAKAAKQSADTLVQKLSTNSTKAEIEMAADSLQIAITNVQVFLTDVQRVLAATITSSSFTSTDLASKKTIIDADRSSVSAQNSAVLAARQAIDTSELTQKKTIDQLRDAFASAQSAYDLAVTNATTQVAAAIAVSNIQKAAYDAAKAALALKKAPPRQADIASLQAAVEQARVAADKATADLLKSQIIAPVDGTISEIIPTIGEQVVPNTIAIKMVGTSGYEVEAQVPEADIAKVAVGQTATMTLDAYGDDVVFQGSVVAEEPDQTKVQEAIYYKVRIQIDPAGRDVKPGMTANVTIRTAEAKSALVIPLRAVRTKTDTGEKTVRVLVAGVPEERMVELGLRGDEGRVEVVSGVKVNESVVTGESTPGAPTP